MKYIIIMSTIIATFSSSAFGESATSGTKASAKLVSSCQIRATDAVFGEYRPNEQMQTTQTFSFLCTNGTPYSLQTNVSSYVAKSHNDLPSNLILTNNKYQVAAIMSNTVSPTERLYYEMYLPWKGYWDVDMDTAAEDQRYKGTGNGLEQTLTVQYRIVQGQYPTPGNYVGTQTAKITF